MSWRDCFDDETRCGGHPDDEPKPNPIPAKCDGCGRFIAKGKAKVYCYKSYYDTYPEYEVLCPKCDEPRPAADATAGDDGGNVCNHPPEAIKEGPRIPLRWGSGPTEVCSRCGYWRSTLHMPGPWKAGPVPTEDDDDD